MVSEGGTVYFVDNVGHRFLSDIANREEGGTPNIIADIRAGIAFKVKQSVGVDSILKREKAIIERVMGKFQKCEELVIVGPSYESTNRLPIFSFLIRKNNRFLHHNFIVALLNDIYGIQSRGGCLCAGPYIEKLLGMNEEAVRLVEELLVGATHEREQYRPGVTRISLPYFFQDEVIDYDIAKHGWRMLQFYRYENNSGEWGHKVGFQKNPHRIWLADLFDESMNQNHNPTTLNSFRDQLEQGLDLMIHTEIGEVASCLEADEFMRWFFFQATLQWSQKK